MAGRVRSPGDRGGENAGEPRRPLVGRRHRAARRARRDPAGRHRVPRRRDAAYIRRVIRVQRSLELGSRAVLLLSKSTPAWLLGTAGLALAKILDNMEIGHNVLHGQWDWMRDPKIHSSTWEWDHAAPAELEALAQRVAPRLHQHPRQGQRPRLRHPARRRGPAVEAAGTSSSRCGTRSTRHLRVRRRDVRPRARRPPAREARRHPGVQGPAAPDAAQGRAGRRPRTTSCIPALSGPSWRSTLTANLTANLVRNVWSHSVIMCGHFPEGVETFEHERARPRARPAASGTSARCSARPTSPARRAAPAHRQPVAPDRAPPLPGPALQPVRARSRRGCGSSSTASGCATTRAPMPTRSPAPGTRCSGSRCPTAGWPARPGATPPAGSPSCCVHPEPARARRPGRLTEPATGAATTPPRDPDPVRPRVVRPPARAPARRPRSGRARTPDRGRRRTPRRGPHPARGVGPAPTLLPRAPWVRPTQICAKPCHKPLSSSGPAFQRASNTSCAANGLPSCTSLRATSSRLQRWQRLLRNRFDAGGPVRQGGQGHRDGVPAVADPHRPGLGPGRRSLRSAIHEVLHAYRRHPSIVGAARATIRRREHLPDGLRPRARRDRCLAGRTSADARVTAAPRVIPPRTAMLGRVDPGLPRYRHAP